MAPKRSTPVQDPSASSSSEEEETASSGEEESSSEDNEPQKNKSSSPPLTQTPKLVKKPDSAKSKSESECGDESDSESEEVAPLDVKSPKSRDVPGKSTSKRASEADRDAKESKRLKTKDADDPKKQLFQRLWSDEDEVALLNGILLFIEKKGTDPAKDMSAFFDFVKKSLHLNVALSQVKDKVMRLKRKFENQIKRGTKGESKIFSKAHDQEVFRLSRKIWGKEGLLGKRKSLLPSVEKKQVGSREIRKLDNGAGTAVKQFGSKGIAKIDRGVGSASMEEYVINKGLDMLDGAKRSEMEQKWMEMHVDELKLFVKRSELIIEQAKLMLEK